MSSCTLFSKMDVRWGFNNVRIKEGDKWKATFLTHEGLFEPTVMFFGLTNSPATFVMMMNTIFCKEVAEGWLSVDIDDIAIHTKPKPAESHRKHLERHLGSPRTGQTQEGRPIPQTRQMLLQAQRNRLPQ